MDLPTLNPRFKEMLATCICESFQLQLFLGSGSDPFCAAYERYSNTGYRQLPFLASTKSSTTGPLAWVVLKKGPLVLGTLACIVVPGRNGKAPLADELADGLLYSSEEAVLEAAGWLRGAGPALTALGPSLYIGGVWLDESLRGRGLVGAMSRLAVAHCLEFCPDLQSTWALEEEIILSKGAMQLPGGLALRNSEKVFEGFFVITGAPKIMYVTWEHVAAYLLQIEADQHAFEEGRLPAWLKPRCKAAS